MSSTPHFFVPAPVVLDAPYLLPEATAHHARSVLRLRIGETVWLHDGQNRRYFGTIAATDKRGVCVHVEREEAVHTEPQHRVTVAQALPKTAERVEQVLQHGTEAGAAGFVLFPSARSVARLEPGEKVARRLLRWQGMVQSAAEQSERGVLPDVSWLPDLPALTATFPQYARVYLLHETATASLPLPKEPAPTLILVGPEGGFTEEEVVQGVQAGAVAVSLGPRILRTETAALIALARLVRD